VIVYLNGSWVEERDARVSIDDAGFLAADGVFETALLHDGGFLHLDQHLERFARSAGMMRLALPAGTDLDAIIRELARRNGLRDAGIRVTLTRGSTAPTLLVTARPPRADWIERARRGWHVITAATRRPSSAAVPAQLKTLGRPWALLARHEAAAAAADDALLLTADGFVCEGPAWNVFWRSGSVLMTPALELGVLAGVTRGIISDLAAIVGCTLQQGAWPRAALDDADEVFATMTSVGVVSLRSLDGQALPDATPVADELRQRYRDHVATCVAADPLR
jgi:branched-chain amino acid aminotransferase